MADIEKIVKEEVEKLKPILNNCQTIFFNGSKEFNDIANNIIKAANDETFLKAITENCIFLIKREFPGSVDVRLLYFASDGFLMLGYTTAFWSNYKLKAINIDIEDTFIEFNNIKNLERTNKENLKIELNNQKNAILIGKYNIFPDTVTIKHCGAFFDLIENIYKRIKNEDNEFKLLIEKFNKIYFENEDWEKSINILNKIIDIYPEDFHLFCYKANCMIEIGNLEEANILLQKSLSNFKKSLNFEKIENWDEGDKDFFSFLKAIEAKLYESKNQILKSIQSTNESLEFTEDQRLKEIRLSRKNERVNKLSR